METNINAGAGCPEAGAQSTEKQSNEKMFTQAEVDRIVSERLSRERRRKAEAGSEGAAGMNLSGQGVENGENTGSAEKTQSWDERLEAVLKDNDYGISAYDMLLAKTFNLERGGTIDDTELARARALLVDEAIKSGKLRPLNGTAQTVTARKTAADSMLRQAFGLRKK